LTPEFAVLPVVLEPFFNINSSSGIIEANRSSPVPLVSQ
jgi:hypothetical protein